MLKEGDYVSRYSYNNDIVFVIVKIEDNNYILKGANERLVADAPIEDLKKEEGRGEEGRVAFEPFARKQCASMTRV